MFTSRKLECRCKQEVKVITQKQTRKTIQANLWLANNHPLNIETFLPLLHVLSFSSKQVRKLSRYLQKYQLPKDKFPLRAKIPLFFFMEATFHFENLIFTGDKPSKGYATIKQSEDIFLIDQKVQEKRKVEILQHYKNLSNLNTKLISNNTEEDSAKHLHTLTKLY